MALQLGKWTAVDSASANPVVIRLMMHGSGRMYCTTCGHSHRMDVAVLYGPTCEPVEVDGQPGELKYAVTEDSMAPSLYQFICGECRTRYTALVYPSLNGSSLAVFPYSGGGLSTPRTPKSVAFYLDQAHKAQSVGALSAAVTMYRAALEHILFEQGFKVRMLGPKIAALKKAIEDGNAPAWARDLDIEFVEVLGELGNYSIHPNDGDIEKQRAFDAPLVARVKDALVELLDLVYEVPARRAERLEALRATKAQLKS